jgi:hypothetical protein
MSRRTLLPVAAPVNRGRSRWKFAGAPGYASMVDRSESPVIAQLRSADESTSFLGYPPGHEVHDNPRALSDRHRLPPSLSFSRRGAAFDRICSAVRPLSDLSLSFGASPLGGVELN